MYLTNLNESLDELLTRKNISLAEFAQSSGLLLSNIYRWKDGQFAPRLKDVQIICNFFKVSSDFLVGLSDNEKQTSFETSTFSKRILKLLTKQNISAYKLAKNCTFNESAVSKWVNNISVPRLINAIELANFFAVPLDYFIISINF